MMLLTVFIESRNLFVVVPMTIIDFCGLVHSVAYDTYKLNRLKDVFDGAHIILQFIY